jgi:hypothetical protein
LTIIRDFKTALWVEFNDQDVRVVSETEAIDDNFGGEFTELSYMESRKRLVRTNKYSSKTAYMLVYVRSSRINEIFDQVRNDRMPEWIRKAEEEKAKQ